ncbi:hypothetical protein H8K36_17440 [Undibacterium sp. LX22W]|uniref:Uncharacterized protein n=2 Tax=Undibacterium TaxID=401469 RepID=A0A923HRC4_9BURK|nr:hypothetical protein [Undibacterium nitidum]MBC3883183.1 hypothetical protein [Undibacterium nitidum]
MEIEKMNSVELLAFISKWRRIFSFFGAVLVCVLIDLVAFHPVGMHQALLFLIGFICVMVCLLAGSKLQDPDRVDAAIDAEVLMSTESFDDD